jgi:transcriptional regulator with XRE-family HTH domain
MLARMARAKMTKAQFARAVVVFRAKSGHTFAELAELCGVNASTAWLWSRGKRYPTPWLRQRVGEVLGVAL